MCGWLMDEAGWPWYISICFGAGRTTPRAAMMAPDADGKGLTCVKLKGLTMVRWYSTHSPWYGTVPSLRHRRGRAGRGGRAGAHNVRSNDDDDHYVASEVAVGHFYSDRLEAMFRVRSNQHKM